MPSKVVPLSHSFTIPTYVCHQTYSSRHRIRKSHSHCSYPLSTGYTKPTYPSRVTIIRYSFSEWTPIPRLASHLPCLRRAVSNRLAVSVPCTNEQMPKPQTIQILANSKKRVRHFSDYSFLVNTSFLSCEKWCEGNLPILLPRWLRLGLFFYMMILT